MKTWIKLYTEINRDPKMGTLSWGQRGIWSALLALAGELDARDEEGRETGALDTLANVAWHLRCDLRELDEAVGAFRERGMVEEREGILYVRRYGERQARPASDSREAVAERVAAYRQRQRNEDVTPLQDDVTPLLDDVTSEYRGVTASDTEADPEQKREEAEAEKTRESAAAAPAAGNDQEEVGDPFELYKHWFGKIDKTAREQIKRREKAWGRDILWRAMYEAELYNITTWAYVDAVAERMLREEDPAEEEPAQEHRGNGHGQVMTRREVAEGYCVGNTFAPWTAALFPAGVDLGEVRAIAAVQVREVKSLECGQDVLRGRKQRGGEAFDCSGGDLGPWVQYLRGKRAVVT